MKKNLLFLFVLLGAIAPSELFAFQATAPSIIFHRKETPLTPPDGGTYFDVSAVFNETDSSAFSPVPDILDVDYGFGMFTTSADAIAYSLTSAQVNGSFVVTQSENEVNTLISSPGWTAVPGIDMPASHVATLFQSVPKDSVDCEITSKGFADGLYEPKSDNQTIHTHATMDVNMYFFVTGFEAHQIWISSNAPNYLEMYTSASIIKGRDFYIAYGNQTQLIAWLGDTPNPNPAPTATGEANFIHGLQGGQTQITFVHLGNGVFYESGEVCSVNQFTSNPTVAEPYEDVITTVYGLHYGGFAKLIQGQERILVNAEPPIPVRGVQVMRSHESIVGIPSPPNAGGGPAFPGRTEKINGIATEDLWITAYGEQPPF